VSDLRKHLELANRHIAEMRVLITEQLNLLREMGKRGEDTKAGEKLLSDFIDSLAAFEAHQRIVLTKLMSRGEMHVSELIWLKEKPPATGDARS